MQVNGLQVAEIETGRGSRVQHPVPVADAELARQGSA